MHVDAAYGGFFRLLADDSADGVAAAPFAAIAACRLDRRRPAQARPAALRLRRVLFADPGVARYYVHDSPYTYFTSDELHLGEISLECSRAGAAAAALWATLQLLPLTPDGLGAVAASRAPRGSGLGRPHRRQRRAHPLPAPGPGHPQLLPRPAAPVGDRPRQRARAQQRHAPARRASRCS